eukprot:ANDGO_00314.mRNA.1 hypothetical protein
MLAGILCISAERNNAKIASMTLEDLENYVMTENLHATIALHLPKAVSILKEFENAVAHFNDGLEFHQKTACAFSNSAARHSCSSTSQSPPSSSVGRMPASSKSSSSCKSRVSSAKESALAGLGSLRSKPSSKWRTAGSEEPLETWWCPHHLQRSEEGTTISSDAETPHKEPVKKSASTKKKNRLQRSDAGAEDDVPRLASEAREAETEAVAVPSVMEIIQTCEAPKQKATKKKKKARSPPRLAYSVPKPTVEKENVLRNDIVTTQYLHVNPRYSSAACFPSSGRERDNRNRVEFLSADQLWRESKGGLRRRQPVVENERISVSEDQKAQSPKSAKPKRQSTLWSIPLYPVFDPSTVESKIKPYVEDERRRLRDRVDAKHHAWEEKVNEPVVAAFGEQKLNSPRETVRFATPPSPSTAAAATTSEILSAISAAPVFEYFSARKPSPKPSPTASHDTPHPPLPFFAHTNPDVIFAQQLDMTLSDNLEAPLGRSRAPGNRTPRAVNTSVRNFQRASQGESFVVDVEEPSSIEGRSDCFVETGSQTGYIPREKSSSKSLGLRRTLVLQENLAAMLDEDRNARRRWHTSFNEAEVSLQWKKHRDADESGAVSFGESQS